MHKTCTIKGFRCRFTVVGLPNRASTQENLLSLYRADISAFEITFKLRSYGSNTDERTTVVIISGIMNACTFKSCPLGTPRNPIWWLISKPYLHSRLSNWYLDISRAQLPKLTYSNPCVWPAGLCM